MKARRFFTFLLTLLSVISITLTQCPPLAGDNISLERRWIHGAVTNVITVDLNDARIRVDVGLPARGIPHSESFSSMVRRGAPLAAVTGTYFDTRTLYPVGSIVIRGKPAYEGAIGTAVCFVKPDSIACANIAGSLANAGGAYTVRFAGTKKGERFAWDGVETGFRTGPRLLREGGYALNPRPEGFRHPGLFGARTRMALGLTAHNKLLLVSVRTPVTFGGLAGIMRALGAMEAVALDGGTSSAMYYKGQFVTMPGRALTNIIEIHQFNLQANTGPVHVGREYSCLGLTNVLVGGIPAHNPSSGAFPAPAIYLRGTFAWGQECPGTWFQGRNPLDQLNQPVQGRNPLDQQAQEQIADLPEQSYLGGTKGCHSIFPINRTKLARLKGLNHPNHFIHIAPDGKVVNHLVA